MRTLGATVAIVCLLSPLLAQAQAPSQAERDAVLGAIQTFFDTMTARDVEGARRVVAPEGRMFSAVEGKGSPSLRSRTLEEYLGVLGTLKQTYKERFWEPEVRIQGPIAMVWTPYDFWVDGKFSHCGIDVFNLVKTPEGWKISGGVYTVQEEGCAPSPLGPPK